MRGQEINSITTDSLDAASRHFNEAVLLFFERRDIIVIHLLANIAHEILGKIGMSGFMRNNPNLTEIGNKKLWKELSDSKNFLKHGDKDVNKKIEFSTGITEMILLDCAYMLNNLTEKSKLEADCYIFFMREEYPDLFIESPKFYLTDIKADIHVDFYEIEKLLKKNRHLK